jgi:hypothetical protein
MTKSNLLVCIIASVSFLQAEHLFEKSSGHPLTPLEHKTAYTITLKHQFPTAPEYNPNYDPDADETTEIQKELDKQLPGVKARWIPRTLYELHGLQYGIEHNLGLTVPIKTYGGKLKSKDKVLVCNTDPGTIEAHKTINDRLVAYLRAHPQMSHESTLLDYSHMSHESTLDYFLRVSHQSLRMFFEEYFKIVVPQEQRNEAVVSELKDLFGRYEKVTDYAVRYELLNRLNSATFLLWRGGSQLPNREFSIQQARMLKDSNEKVAEHDKEWSYISVSYGAGLFTARTTDPGACPMFYIAEESYSCSYGYVLPINKKDSIAGNRFFVVPPLVTVAALFSGYVAFHPRTSLMVSRDEYESLNLRCIEGFSGTFPNLLIKYLQSQKDATIVRAKRQKYVIKNALPLTAATAVLIKNAQDALQDNQVQEKV